MTKKLLLSLLAGFAVLVCFWLFITQKPAQPASPNSPQVLVAPAPVMKPAITNIPGIGPISTDPKEIARIKAKTKRDLDEAFKGSGFFTNPAELREAQETGEIAWIFINGRKNLEMAMEHITKSATEPFPPRLLEALEHVLKHGTDAQMKLTAAALLYRYNQPSGKAYLLSVLDSPTTDLRTRDVVLALAMNRETEAISGIVAAFPKLGPPPTHLLLAIGSWNEPSLGTLLRQQYQLNRKNWGYALALAQTGHQDAVTHLTETLATHKSLGYLAFTIEATLVKDQALDASVWQVHMQEMFKKAPSTGDSTILPAFEVAGSQASSKLLQEMLASTVPLHEEMLAGMEVQAKRVRDKDPMAYNWFPKDSPIGFMKGAALLLAQWDAKEAVPTLQQVLTTVQQGGRANVYVNEALGLALYKLDPANWRETLLNAGIPPYHVDRIPALAKLRPIPPAYLPKQVNLNAR